MIVSTAIKTFVTVFTAICLWSFPISAQNLNAVNGSVNVSGDADIFVSPDEAVVIFTVRILHKKFEEAVKDSDERVTRLLSFLKGSKILPRHIQMLQMDVQTKYHSYQNSVEHYIAHKSIAVVVKNIDRLEIIVRGGLANGANGLDGVHYRCTDLRKHRDSVREMAMKAAKEKAQDLAEAIGQKIGKASLISETHNNIYRRNMSGQHNLSQNVNQHASSRNEGGLSGETLIVGEMRVSASVNVTFHLF